MKTRRPRLGTTVQRYMQFSNQQNRLIISKLQRLAYLKNILYEQKERGILSTKEKGPHQMVKPLRIGFCYLLKLLRSDYASHFANLV